MSIRNKILEQIRDAMFNIRDNSVISGYGSIGLDNPKAIGTIASTPVTIQGFDAELIAVPREVTQDIATNSLAVNSGGVWSVYIKISLTFDEVNFGRSISVRTFNLTDGTPGSDTYTFFVGRNTGGVNISISQPVDIPQAGIGKKIQIQVFSDLDTFTNTLNIGSLFSLTNNSALGAI